MAQWSHTDRVLHAKLVYYGPAFGGKTTNLESLHRITDPQGKQKLLSIKTEDDRTLFFDLLPLELGSILGYQVAIKLYTVPGQVRYDTTRQVVLAGADAVVFVADSTPARRDTNVWSLQNLRMNMRARGLDPTRVPVVCQFNKQDLPDAAPPAEVASWLGLRADRGFAAVAIEGRGVLETFQGACRAMLENIVASAGEQTRKRIDVADLRRQVDRAFAPYVALQAERDGGERPRAGASAATPVVVGGDDILRRSVESSVQLGERLVTETTRSARLEREAEAFRRLGESLRSVGASFDRRRIVDAALDIAREILGAAAISLIYKPSPAETALERASGRDTDPLLAFEGGRALLDRVLALRGPCVVEDLLAECPGAERPLEGLRALAAVPVEAAGARTLVAYAPWPDGAFQHEDVRFLATVAGNLAAGLEKARLHEDLARHRDRLEETVSARTRQLREAYEGLRSLDHMKDSFLSNLSHEMKTPLTAILGSAYALRDYKSSASERKELVGSIVIAAEALQRMLDDLFRLVNLENGSQPLQYGEAEPLRLIEEAIELAGHREVRFEVPEWTAALQLDLPRLARALANLIDNAVKFSPEEPQVQIEIRPAQLGGGGGAVEAISLSVLDRGPGVPAEDRNRIFAPFEQGGDPLTAKPPGIGIGLHEARTIARSHGGDLIYVPRDGGGSEFRLTVPLKPPEATTIEEVR